MNEHTSCRYTIALTSGIRARLVFRHNRKISFMKFCHSCNFGKNFKFGNLEILSNMEILNIVRNSIMEFSNMIRKLPN